MYCTLARLGLRADEIRHLGDIDWASARLYVHGKARTPIIGPVSAHIDTHLRRNAVIVMSKLALFKYLRGDPCRLGFRVVYIKRDAA